MSSDFREHTYPLKEIKEEITSGIVEGKAESFQEKKEEIIRSQGSNMEHRDE